MRIVSIIIFTLLFASGMVYSIANFNYDKQQRNQIPPQNTIFIENYTFYPSEITVPTGTQVIWINKDAVAHNIVSDGSLFSSGNVFTGGSYKKVFDEPGSYPYHSSLHSLMKGEIIVQ